MQFIFPSVFIHIIKIIVQNKKTLAIHRAEFDAENSDGKSTDLFFVYISICRGEEDL